MADCLFATQAAAAAFAAALPTQRLGRSMQYFERTQSTNDLALQAARNGAPHGALFIADVQDAGRGRRGRQWESQPGLSLLFSVLLRPENLPVAEFGWVPLIVGLAMNDALQRAAGVSATIKWPNDLVIPSGEPPGWRKLGGILCESVLPSGSAAGFVVAGVGVNVNHTATELPHGTKAPPTSVLLETNRRCDRAELLREMLVSLEMRNDALNQSSRRDEVKVEVQQRLKKWWPEERLLRVQCSDSSGELKGAFAGLDEYGRLIVRTPNGREQLLADAEIVAVQ